MRKLLIVAPKENSDFALNYLHIAYSVIAFLWPDMHSKIQPVNRKNVIRKKDCEYDKFPLMVRMLCSSGFSISCGIQ